MLALLAASSARAGELSLSETASREVENDRFTARLEGRTTADDPATAQAELNALMADALAAVADAPALEVETGAYDVRPQPDREPDDDDDGDADVERWIARQTLSVDGAERAAIVDTVATLQARGLATLGLGSRLSDARADGVRDALVREAVAALRARADLAAAAFDREITDWLTVRIDGARPLPRAMQADTATATAPPALTVGTTTVRVTVEATAAFAADADR
jgi:predicted secreted protein